MISLVHAASSPPRTLGTAEQCFGTCLPTVLHAVNPLPSWAKFMLASVQCRCLLSFGTLTHVCCILVSLLCFHHRCTYYMSLLRQWAHSHLATCISRSAQAGLAQGKFNNNKVNEGSSRAGALRVKFQGSASRKNIT